MYSRVTTTSQGHVRLATSGDSFQQVESAGLEQIEDFITGMLERASSRRSSTW
jgi:hypothetical protein